MCKNQSLIFCHVYYLHTIEMYQIKYLKSTPSDNVLNIKSWKIISFIGIYYIDSPLGFDCIESKCTIQNVNNTYYIWIDKGKYIFRTKVQNIDSRHIQLSSLSQVRLLTVFVCVNCNHIMGFLEKQSKLIT